MKALQFPSPTFEKHYEQLDISYAPDQAAVWFTNSSQRRPCFTPNLLNSIRNAQQTIVDYVKFGGDSAVPVNYLVTASSVDNIYNLGGDLALFKQLIEAQDREGLREYAYACIDVLHNNMTNLGLDLTTIALVQGSALGGGFEAALSCNVIIAEKGAEFGFPEILFNLFPGMGAYSMLSRKISQRDTEQMLTNGKMYTAEELFDMGVVDILAERGEGEAALHEYINNHRRARNGLTGIQRARQLINPITYEELADVTYIWVDAALKLEPRNLRLIDRLVRAQNRRAEERTEETTAHFADNPQPMVAAGHGSYVMSEGGKLVQQLQQEGSSHIPMAIGKKNPFTFFKSTALFYYPA